MKYNEEKSNDKYDQLEISAKSVENNVMNVEFRNEKKKIFKPKVIEFCKRYKLVFIALFISFLIEIFICNFAFWRTLFVGNNNIKKDYIIAENSIIISDINTRITSIYFEYNNKLTDKITYDLFYRAEENSDRIAINPKIILKDAKHYINFDTHSLCKEIEIHLLTETELDIKGIYLNYPNLSINAIRIMILFMAVIFISKLKNESFFKDEYNSDSKKQNGIFIVNLATLCFFIFLYAICQLNYETFFIDKKDINKEDSILMQAESIMNNQIELMEEPSKELKELDNPYDSIKRDEQGINYLYDVAYYNGKYYNYFGIAPIITSILPFRILTGKYTHTYIFNLLYIFISVISLYFLYKKLIKKFVKTTLLFNFYLGFYALLFGSNIFTLLRGQKYDIVVSSGIAFLLISLNLALSICNNKKYKFLKLVFLGITTALIVLSKPNLIVYYCIIYFLIMLSMQGLTMKEKLNNYCIILIPLGIFAIFQMYLNYIRFDNVLEFGAKYQLTGFNMNYCMFITFGKIYAGVVEYMLKTPIINPLKFPFVFINTDTAVTSINEVCYENRLIGLIGIPILYSYLFKNNINQLKTNNKELNMFLNLCIITSMLSIIINTCFGGICEAYSIDFKMMLSLGAILILLKIIEDNRKNKIIQNSFIILCIATLCIMIPINLTTESNFLINFASDTTVFFKNVFEFWS